MSDERRDPHRGIDKTLGVLGSKQEQTTGKAERERKWDRKNPAFSFRIRPEDAQRLKQTAQQLAVPKDALTRALMQAALDALDDGRLVLTVQERRHEVVDKLGRERTFIKKTVLAAWAREQTSE